MGIAENLQLIRQQMAEAAMAIGKKPEDIILVGASKMNDADACREAIAAGIDVLGENKVQEMRQKLEEGGYVGVPLHFIGHLQRNKVRQVVGDVDLIQSVGSVALLDEIGKCATKRGITQGILLEVNVGREEAKSGFFPEDVEKAAAYAKTVDGVLVEGLMTIPPATASKEENMAYFTEVARLYVDIGEKLYDNQFRYLSMGMSGDFVDAIACGANMVRVGSAIFGKRAYQLV